MPFFFWFDLFLDTRAEILINLFFGSSRRGLPRNDRNLHLLDYGRIWDFSGKKILCLVKCETWKNNYGTISFFNLDQPLCQHHCAIGILMWQQLAFNFQATEPLKFAKVNKEMRIQYFKKKSQCHLNIKQEYSLVDVAPFDSF